MHAFTRFLDGGPDNNKHTCLVDYSCRKDRDCSYFRNFFIENLVKLLNKSPFFKSYLMKFYFLRIHSSWY